MLKANIFDSIKDTIKNNKLIAFITHIPLDEHSYFVIGRELLNINNSENNSELIGTSLFVSNANNSLDCISEINNVSCAAEGIMTRYGVKIKEKKTGIILIPRTVKTDLL